MGLPAHAGLFHNPFYQAVKSVDLTRTSTNQRGIHEMTAQPKPAASGKWTIARETQDFHGIVHTTKIYTFHAESGYTAVMRKEHGRPTKEPYTAEIKDPQNQPAQYLADDGRRIYSMTLGLNLRDAKLTVQENVHRAEQLAAAEQRQNLAQVADFPTPVIRWK